MLIYPRAELAGVKQITSPRILSGVYVRNRQTGRALSWMAIRETRQIMRPEPQRQIGQGEAESRLWLSGLIDAAELAQRPDIRRQPVAPETLARLRAQLALTSSCRPSRKSHLHR